MVTVQATIDRSSPVPLYFQIAQQMQAAIDSGTLPPGTRLDNEIDLAARLGVSRPTMRRAIDMLTEDGLVVRRRGIGTVVVPRRVRRPVALTSLYDDLAAAERRPHTRVLSLGLAPADHQVAAALGVLEGHDILAVERLRLADDLPVALMRNYLPADFEPQVTREALEQTGLYELLRRGGATLAAAQQSIGARRASAAEERVLEVPRGSVVLTMTRTAYDRMGHAVEYGSHCYPAERYSFEMSLANR